MAQTKRHSVRTSLSLFLSGALHASAIALIALGPTFIPGLNNPVGDRTSSTVEFTVDASTPTTVADAPLQPMAPPAPVAEVTPTPEPAPKKVKVAKAPKTEPIPTQLPDKAETAVVQQEESPVVQPQPEEVAKAAEELQAVEETLAIEESVAAAAAAQEIQETPVPQETPAPVEDPTPVAQQQTPEPTPEAAIEKVPAPNEEALATAAPAAATTTAQSAGQAGETAAQPAPTATQNYLGLRQMPGNVPPAYTRESRLQNLQGRGQLVYFVTKEGQVSDVQLTKSTGSKVLDQAAVEAFKKYRFVPGQEGRTVHDFEFSLKGPAQTEAGRLRTATRR